MKLTQEWLDDPEGKHNLVVNKAQEDYNFSRISLDERDEIVSMAKEYKAAAIKERTRRRMEA